MKKEELMLTMKRTLGRANLTLRKYSPEILVAGGIVGTVVTTVMACKATTKLDSVLAEHEEKIKKTKEYVEENGFDDKVYSEKDYKNDLTILYTKSAVSVLRLYAPSIALGALSITAILAGHNILRKRNVAIAAAYATIEQGFKDYRGRVVERFGEEVDHELRYNIRHDEIEETVKDEKTGKEKKIKKTVDVIDPNSLSDYCRWFNDTCPAWSKDPEFNLMFLRDQQRYMNDLLKTRGHVYLNGVYDALGFPRTNEGQIIGWLYDENDPTLHNYIDFGIYDHMNANSEDFVNGYTRDILLDFNPDGNILSLM